MGGSLLGWQGARRMEDAARVVAAVSVSMGRQAIPITDIEMAAHALYQGNCLHARGGKLLNVSLAI